MNIISLFMLITAYFMYSTIKDRKSSVLIFVFVLYSIPFFWAVFDFTGVYLDFGFFKLNIQDFIFLSLIVFLLPNLKTIKNWVIDKKILIFNSIWLLLIAVFLIVGLFNNHATDVLNDARRFMYHFTIIIFFFFVANKQDMKRLVKVLIVATLVFSLFDLAIFLFRKTIFLEIIEATQWVGHDRVGFVNSVVVTFIIPIVIFADFLKDRKWKVLSYTTIFLLLITIFMAKSAMMTVISVFVLGLSLLIKGYSEMVEARKAKEEKRVKKLVYTSLGILSLSAILAFYAINSESGILKSYVEKVYISLTDADKLPSWRSRQITNQNAAKELKHNVWGYGLGKTFKTYIQTGEIANPKAMYVDNTFYTALVKFGIIGASFYFVVVFFNLYLLIRNVIKAKANNKPLLLGLVISYLGLLLTMPATAQILIQPPVIVASHIIVYASVIFSKEETK